MQEFINEQSPRDIRKIKRKFQSALSFGLGDLYRAGDVDDFKECKKRYGFSLYEFIVFNFRFFFVMIERDIAVTYHSFRKKGQKTPQKEVDKAMRIAVEILRKKYLLK